MGGCYLQCAFLLLIGRPLLEPVFIVLVVRPPVPPRDGLDGPLLGPLALPFLRCSALLIAASEVVSFLLGFLPRPLTLPGMPLPILDAKLAHTIIITYS